MSEKKFLNQCHETIIIEENGQKNFIKKFIPFSYELTNEIRWLTDEKIKKCASFQTPHIVSYSLKDGYIKMQYINDSPTNIARTQKKISRLIIIAAELHSIINTSTPLLKYPIPNSSKYTEYIIEYTKKRIKRLEDYNYLNKNISKWIMKSVQLYNTETFTITHRDLRPRHLLWSQENEKPFLIDWEYTNISDPAQDIAKIIYEYIRKNTKEKNIINSAISIIAEYKKQKKSIIFSEILNRVLNFLLIISIENSASLLSRKPKGYHNAIIKELQLLYNFYEETHHHNNN